MGVCDRVRGKINGKDEDSVDGFFRQRESVDRDVDDQTRSQDVAFARREAFDLIL